MLRPSYRIISIFLSALLLASCDNDTAPPPDVSVAIGGNAQLGNVVNGIVSVKTTDGQEIATAVTDANGDFGPIDVVVGTSGPVIIEITPATDGSSFYICDFPAGCPDDTSPGDIIPFGDQAPFVGQLLAVVAEVGTTLDANVNPLTSAVHARAQQLGGLTAANVAQANSEMASELNRLLDVAITTPIDQIPHVDLVNGTGGSNLTSEALNVSLLNAGLISLVSQTGLTTLAAVVDSLSSGFAATGTFGTSTDFGTAVQAGELIFSVEQQINQLISLKPTVVQSLATLVPSVSLPQASSVLKATRNQVAPVAPTISGNTQLSTLEDEVFTFTPIAVDKDGDVLAYSITNKPGWAAFDSTTGQLTGTPTNADVGTTEFTIAVSDGTSSASLTSVLEVVNVNDAPVITGTPATSTLESAVYAFTPTATDVDSQNLTFSISRAPSFVTFNSATGNITGTPNNSHVGIYTDIVISVSDGSLSASLPAFSLTVINVNDLPIVTGSTGTVVFTEGGGAIVVDDALTVVDTDHAFAQSAKVSVTGGYVAAEDVLSFTAPEGITGNFDATTGVLSITGQATTDAYASLLKTVTYNNANVDNPSVGDRAVGFTVNDGEGDSVIVSRAVSIVAINDVPVLAGTGGEVSYTEGDGARVIDSSLVAGDVDDVNLEAATVSLSAGFNAAEDQLAVAPVTGITSSFDASTGVLSLSGSASLQAYSTALASVTYTNSNNDNPDTTARQVTYLLNDGDGSSAAVNRSIAVTRVNDQPVVTGTATTLNYTEGDSATLVNTSIAITDVDDTNIESAVVQISSGFVSTEDQLSFASQSGVTGSFSSTTGILSFTGAATPDVYATLLKSVTYTNTNTDNPGTTARVVSFVVNDGESESTGFAQTITVLAVNDVPVVSGSGSTLVYAEGDGAKAIDSTLAVVDVDDSAIETATISFSSGFKATEDQLNFTSGNGITGTFDASTGVLSLSGSASLAAYSSALASVTYTNTNDANPSTENRVVNFIANDGDGDSDVVRRTISVSGVNDLPLASSRTITIAEDTTHTFAASDFNFSDIDGDSLASVKVTVLVTKGTLQNNGQNVALNQAVSAADLAAGNLKFTPAANDYGTAYDNFSFTVSDGTADSAAASVITFNVTAVNDAPTVTNPPSPLLIFVDQAFDYTPTIVDPDSVGADGEVLTISVLETLPSWLSFTSSTGRLMGTPLLANIGFQAVTITATDDEGLSGSLAFTLEVRDSSTVTLSWTRPTARVNGSPIPVEELDHYDVEYRLSGQSNTIVSVAKTLTSYTTPKLAPGTYIFKLRVVDFWGLQSDYTSEVQAVVN